MGWKLGLFFFLLGLPSVAWTQGRVGSEFQVNSYTTSYQLNPSVAMDTVGNFVVTWTSYGDQDGSSTGIFGQRFAANGARQGGEFQVNSYTTSGQFFPQVGVDTDGDFVVVWGSEGQDGSSYGVFGQRFASDGTPLGGEFQVNSYTTGYQFNYSVAMDSDGDFVVVWSSDGQDGSFYGIFGQRFAADGTRQGGEFQVHSYTTSYQRRPSVAVDADGDFVVVWDSLGQDGSGYGIFGRRFAANGAPLGAEFQVHSYTTSYQRSPSVAVDADGDFVVVWDSLGQDGSARGVFGQRFAPDGTRRGGEFQVNSYTTNTQLVRFGASAVATDADGDFVVTWISQGQDGSSNGIFGQRFEANGARLGGEFQVNSYTAGSQYRPSVAVDTDGDFVVVWSSDGQDGSSLGIFGQRFTPVSGPLAIRSNLSSFSTGDTLVLSVNLNNPGAPLTLDFYFGALLPDGDTILFFTDLAFTPALGSLSNVATLQPMVAGLHLSTPFQVDEPSFLTHGWVGLEPVGGYVMFLAAVVPGAFADGTVDPGDILGLSTAVFTFTP